MAIFAKPDYISVLFQQISETSKKESIKSDKANVYKIWLMTKTKLSSTLLLHEPLFDMY